VLVGGRASHLTTKESVELAAMPPLKLVTPSRRHSLRSRLEQLIDEGAFKVARKLEIEGLLTTMRFVRQSDFVALLPRMAVADELDDPRFVVAAIAETLPGFSCALVHRRQPPLARCAHPDHADRDRNFTRTGKSVRVACRITCVTGCIGTMRVPLGASCRRRSATLLGQPCP